MNHLLIALVFSTIITSLPIQALAVSFDPNTIISDSDFFNTNEMSVQDIQFFLERKGSALRSYRALNTDGIVASASEIIHSAGKAYGINPKVLLVLLQKEQSLIENPTPTQYNYDWATGFARCDSCSANDPAISVYKGFGAQVTKAAWRKMYYTTHWNEFASRPNQLVLIDGMPVTPTNAATAALYNYTPHLRGNMSFWKLWNRYFSRVIPDGTIVQAAGTKEIWIIQDSKRRLFTSLSAFLSRYGFNQVVFLSQQDLEKYSIGTPIKFPQYSLLRNQKGAVFLFANEGLYGIPSKKIFKSIGFNPDEVIDVSSQDISDIPLRGLITDALNSPVGELMQDTKTGGIYHVIGSVKHPLLERVVLLSNFPSRRIKPASQELLSSYSLGDPVLFEDGTLITSPGSPAVYVISNGQKRAVASEYAFISLGYQWGTIIRSQGTTLALHTLGDPIDLGSIEEEVLPLALTTP